DAGPTTRAARAALLRLDGRRRGPARAAAPGAAPAGTSQRLYAHAGEVLGVAFTADGRVCVSAGRDGKVRRWDVGAGRELPPLPDHPGGAFAVATAPAGSRVATAGADGKVRLSDAATGREDRVLAGHDGPVYAVAFGPDGRLVASGGRDGSARVWDAAGKQLLRLDVIPDARSAGPGRSAGVTGVVFTADG